MGKYSHIGKMAGQAVRYLIATVSLSVVLYILFALFFSTEEERRLQRENRLYAELYGGMKAKEQLIGDVVLGLQSKDNAIYLELFQTPAPMPDALTAADLIADSDSLSESFYLSSAASASGRLMMMASSVDDNFAEIFRMIEARRKGVPPLTLPLQDFSYAQTGTSVGLKHNPVYKLDLQHNGLDLIAPQGAGVYAAASGTVSKVIHTRKGLGNTVEIDHGNGYITRYCLLGDVFAQRGRPVRRGQRIGTVGISASVDAPHLHYEVLRDSALVGGPAGHYGFVDPVNHLFASLDPSDYARLLYMSVSSTRSLD